MKTYRVLTLVLAVTTAAMTAAGMGTATGGGTPPPEQAPTRRDPFWPVGYQKVSETEQRERTKIEDLKSRIRWPALPLRGISHTSGKRFIAILDGIGLVEPGDVVSIRQDHLIYRWRIDNVSAEGVSSTRLDVTETHDMK